MTEPPVKITILVVEDDALFRRALIHRLTTAGYEVISAPDGREALNWLNNPVQMPHLVLLDILMPIYSGLDVLTKIKTLPRKVPVILMSHADKQIARQAVEEANPDAFLEKPFSMEDLLALIRQLLPATPHPTATA